MIHHIALASLMEETSEHKAEKNTIYQECIYIVIHHQIAMSVFMPMYMERIIQLIMVHIVVMIEIILCMKEIHIICITG